MKHFLALGIVAAAAIAQPTTTSAQSLPFATIPRHDVTFTVGWLNGNKGDLTGAERDNNWFNDGLYGASHFGWYWSDQHKTEVELGVSNTSDLYIYRNFIVGTRQTSQSSELTSRTTRLAIGQQYQFFRNAWVHPHVTGGVDLIWETTSEHVEYISTYDIVTRQSIPVRPPPDIGPETRMRVRPFGEVGFKSYLTPKTFFRADLRITARDRFDQVLLRCGFGVDF